MQVVGMLHRDSQSLFRKLSVHSFPCLVAHFPVFPFWSQIFSFAVGSCVYCVVLLNAPYSELGNKFEKRVYNALIFLENLAPLSLMPGGPVVPLKKE